jgi:hypothetical protein
VDVIVMLTIGTWPLWIQISVAADALEVITTVITFSVRFDQGRIRGEIE